MPFLSPTPIQQTPLPVALQSPVLFQCQTPALPTAASIPRSQLSGEQLPSAVSFPMSGFSTVSSVPKRRFLHKSVRLRPYLPIPIPPGCMLEEGHKHILHGSPKWTDPLFSNQVFWPLLR